jgi:hypothetical protein
LRRHYKARVAAASVNKTWSAGAELPHSENEDFSLLRDLAAMPTSFDAKPVTGHKGHIIGGDNMKLRRLFVKNITQEASEIGKAGKNFDSQLR